MARILLPLLGMTYRDPVTGELREDPSVARPVAPVGDQVNVNAGGTTYVAQTSPLTIVRRVVGLIFGILIGLIVLRVVLLLLGANEGNAIVDTIYGVTEPLVAPFRGIFAIDQVSPTGSSALDVAALVAIVGWALIAFVITAILRIPDRA